MKSDNRRPTVRSVFKQLMWLRTCTDGAVRLAIRQLRKNPGFAITTILTLALGVGATTAIFSLVNAVLLRPLPFPEPERLVFLQQADVEPGAPADTPEPLSYPDFFDWRARSHSLSGLACYRRDSVTLIGPRRSAAARGGGGFAGVLSGLGRASSVGSWFPSGRGKGRHARGGSELLVVAIYLRRRARYGGQPITLNGHSYTVAGVMPRGFPFRSRTRRPRFGRLWQTMPPSTRQAIFR